jgi:hypothetical protein
VLSVLCGRRRGAQVDRTYEIHSKWVEERIVRGADPEKDDPFADSIYKWPLSCDHISIDTYLPGQTSDSRDTLHLRDL